MCVCSLYTLYCNLLRCKFVPWNWFINVVHTYTFITGACRHALTTTLVRADMHLLQNWRVQTCTYYKTGACRHAPTTTLARADMHLLQHWRLQIYTYNKGADMHLLQHWRVQTCTYHNTGACGHAPTTTLARADMHLLQHWRLQIYTYNNACVNCCCCSCWH